MRYTANDCIAFDRKSMRYTAGNGYFHVVMSPLTKAQVAPYRGRELVDHEQRGLDPDKIYYVYRPAEELSSEETVRSVIGIPITLEHEYIDPEVKPENMVGMTGDHPKWRAPYLMNSLHITNADAVRRIEDDSMRQLSLGYTYDPEWTAGETADGEHYDLIMRNIRANHVALVEEGRAGPDVMVFDDNKAVKPHEGSIAMDDNVKQALSSIAQSIMALVNEKPQGESMVVPATDEDTADILAAPEDEGAANEDDEDADTVADEDIAAPEDEDAAADDDDEVATDSDDEEAACDSDEEGVCDEDEEVAEDEDPDPEAIKQLLESNGLPTTPEMIKAVLLGGKDKAQQAVAGDSKRGLKVKRTGAKAVKRSLTTDSVRRLMNKQLEKRMSAFQASVKNRVNAARRVRKTLGDVNPLAYDSASDIYRAAIRKLGKQAGANASLAALRDSYDLLYSAQCARRKVVAADTGASITTGTASLLNDLVGSKVIY